MLFRPVLRAVVVVAAMLAMPQAAGAADSPPTTQQSRPLDQSQFLRFVDRGSNGSRLETSDVAFRNDRGVTIHLVAAVHIAEKSYFQALNENFKLRDVVLYEMVKPRDAAVPKPGEPTESHSAISQAQRMMKDVLGLDFQLDDIEYGAPNFVHADLDAETFAELQNERGESMQSLMLQGLMKSLAHPEHSPQVSPGETNDELEDLIKAFTRPDMERQFKLRLARQMASMEAGPLGTDALSGTVLLTERNNAALAALDQQLTAGKKDIAIFYGAAHMPELSQKLADRGFQPIATEWRLAWDLTIRPDEPSAVEKAMIELLHNLDDQ